MDDRIYKYLQDILNAILEIETATNQRGKNYNVFIQDFVFRKFAERNIEIIGEAMNRILRINPDINITAARKIVDTRNFVIHSYDSLMPEIIWSIIITHIPRLKSEIETILLL